MKVCDLGIAVSCADCPSPFVRVYDKNLAVQYTVPMTKSTLERYNLEINQPNSRSFNVFYTTRTSLSLIQSQFDLKGNQAFNTVKDIFTITSSQNETIPNEVYVSSEGDYVVLKSQSMPQIYVTVVCRNEYQYSSAGFECLPCPTHNKTYGIQETVCQACNKLFQIKMMLMQSLRHLIQSCAHLVVRNLDCLLQGHRSSF